MDSELARDHVSKLLLEIVIDLRLNLIVNPHTHTLSFLLLMT